MKSIVKILLVSSFFISFNAYADHTLGGEINYEVIDSITRKYKIKMRLYRDCCGIAFNSTETISASFSTCPSFNFSMALIKKEYIIRSCNGAVSPTCGGGPCFNAYTMGVELNYYEGIVTLPSCGIATLTYSTCCWSILGNLGVQTIDSTNQGISIDCKINTELNKGNNSSIFYNNPFPSPSNNVKFHYNFNSIDPDGDSMVCFFVNPLENVGIPVIWKPGYSANKFVDIVEPYVAINNQTGEFTFTPNYNTNYFTSTFSVKVVEYRRLKKINGLDSMVYAGETTRNTNFYGQPSSNIEFSQNGIIPSSMSKGVSASQNEINVCNTGKPMKFKWVSVIKNMPNSEKPKASIPELETFFKDNNSFSFIYFTKKDTNHIDSIFGDVTYLPSLSKKGCNKMVFYIDYCLNAQNVRNTYSFNVCFNETLQVDSGLYYCTGGIPQMLSAIGGTQFVWTPKSNIVKYNKADSSSISVTPTATTYYVVQSNINISNSGCKNKDSIKVVNVPAFSYTLTPKKDTICQGDVTPIYINVNPIHGPYTINWNNSQTLTEDSTGKIKNGLSNPIAMPSVSTNYIVEIKSKYQCIIKDSVSIKVGNPLIKPIVKVNRDTICLGDTSYASVLGYIPTRTGPASIDCIGINLYSATIPNANTDQPSSTCTGIGNCYPSIYGANNPSGSSKHRMVYTKAELNAMGINKPCILKSIGFYTWSANQNQYKNFQIRMGATSGLDANANVPMFLVHNPKTTNIQVNNFTYHDLDIPFSWDGISNIIVETSFKNDTASINTIHGSTVSTSTPKEVAYYIPSSPNMNALDIYTPVYSDKKLATRFQYCEALSPLTSSIKWSSNYAGNTFSNDTGMNTIFTINKASTISATIGKDKCSNTSTKSIKTDQNFGPYICNKDTFICVAGSSVKLCVCGSLSGCIFLWYASTLAVISGLTNAEKTMSCPTVSPSSTTVFYLKVTKGLCVVYDTVTVYVATMIPVSLSSSSPLCNSNSGSITAITPGNSIGYTYHWAKNGINMISPNKTLLNVGPGTYTVTVTNPSGCAGYANRTITINNSPLTLGITKSNITCSGLIDGIATVPVISGGLPQSTYTYMWSINTPSSGSKTKINLAKGVYTVTVTDDTTGCVGSQSFTIYEPDSLKINVDSIDAKCFNTQTGKIIFNPSGGTSPYSYSWTHINNSPNGSTVFGYEENLPIGKYYVTVVDANGCSSSGHTEVFQPTILTYTKTFRNTSILNGDSGYIVVKPSGGVPLYSFDWASTEIGFPKSNFDLSKDSIFKLHRNIYHLTVTDHSGCTINDTIEIIDTICNGKKIILNADITQVKCFGQNNAKIKINSVMGMTSPLSYLWSNGSIKDSITGLFPNTYKLTITDGVGPQCILPAIFKITQPTNYSLFISQSNFIACYGESTAIIDLYPDGGNGGDIYTWKPFVGSIQGPFIENLPSNKYIITATDSKGCVAKDSITILQPSLLEFATSIADSAQCHGYNNGKISISGKGGSVSIFSPYKYSIGVNPFTSNGLFTNLISGNYTTFIKDSNDCIASKNINIYEPLPLNLNILPVDSVYPTNTTILLKAKLNTSSGVLPTILSYSWDPIFDMACPTCSQTNWVIPSNTIVTLSVTYGKLCSSSVQKYFSTYIPNKIIEPRSDIYKVFGEKMISDIYSKFNNDLKYLKLDMYNILGERIYSNDHIVNGWSESNIDKKWSSATYFYKITIVKKDNSSETIEGKTILMR
jgi:hypothetical protein